MQIDSQAAMMLSYIHHGLNTSGEYSIALGDPGHPSNMEEGERLAMFYLQTVCTSFIERIPENWPNGEAPFGPTLAGGDFFYHVCPKYLAHIVDNYPANEWYARFVAKINTLRIKLTPINHIDDVKDAALLTAFIAIELEIRTTPSQSIIDMMGIGDHMGHVELMDMLYETCLTFIGDREWEWEVNETNRPTVEFIDCLYVFSVNYAYHMATDQALPDVGVMNSMIGNFFLT